MSERVCPSCGTSSSSERCASCGVVTLAPREFAGGAPHEGETFAGKYAIEKRIGSGGMGVVYRAHQINMDRAVALKVLHRRMASDLSAVQRFYREMKAATRVEHPNTVRIYDFGHTEAGDLFLAMELLQGETLLQLINREGSLAAERIVRIGIQIAKALGAAHAAGVVHRDLKPENVFVLQVYGEMDYVKVLDFGVARFSGSRPEDSGPTLTTTGQVVGTPYYMSPEQAMGKQVDHRSDIYSLGVVLYRLATGRVPFNENTPMMVLYQHVHQPPPPPNQVVPGCVPPALESVILRLLAKAPEDRPQTAEDVIGLLEASVSGAMATVSLAQPAAARTRESQAASAAHTSRIDLEPGRRSRAGWLIAGVVVVGAIAGVVWFILSQEEPPGASEPARLSTLAAEPPARNDTADLVQGGSALAGGAAEKSRSVDDESGRGERAAGEVEVQVADGGAEGARQAAASPGAPEASALATLALANAPAAQQPAVVGSAAEPVPSPPTSPAAAEAAGSVQKEPAQEPPAARMVYVASEPAGASVYRGEHKLGVTPVAVDLAPGEAATKLRIELAGYDAAWMDLDSSSQGTVVARLVRKAHGKGPGSRPLVRGPSTAGEGGGGQPVDGQPKAVEDKPPTPGTQPFDRWGIDDAPKKDQPPKDKDSRRWD